MPPFEDNLLFSFTDSGSKSNHLIMIERTIKEAVGIKRIWFVKVNDSSNAYELFTRTFYTYDEAVKTYIGRVAALVK